ncbi:hypothetical protein [Nitrosopumilus sp.]|uniref:hypothetical protein n=1 Tax=Nitrosopumilus sp. TaxID=2024843 RepID=UPI003B5B8A3F
MQKLKAFLGVVFGLVFLIFSPQAFAEPTVSINMEKTTYSYCERLFYIIEVSEVTGEPAIIHIRDELGKGSSAIPIPIVDLQNPVPSLIPFEKQIFPSGKYFIDVEYSGAEFTAEFELVDTNKICIPEIVKPILANWLSGNISDGFLIDAFKKYMEENAMNIPYEINQENVYEVTIPEWMRTVGIWWAEGKISDEEFIQNFDYLIEKRAIMIPILMENEI